MSEKRGNTWGDDRESKEMKISSVPVNSNKDRSSTLPVNAGQPIAKTTNDVNSTMEHHPPSTSTPNLYQAGSDVSSVSDESESTTEDNPVPLPQLPQPQLPQPQLPQPQLPQPQSSQSQLPQPPQLPQPRQPTPAPQNLTPFSTIPLPHNSNMHNQNTHNQIIHNQNIHNQNIHNQNSSLMPYLIGQRDYILRCEAEINHLRPLTQQQATENNTLQNQNTALVQLRQENAEEIPRLRGEVSMLCEQLRRGREAGPAGPSSNQNNNPAENPENQNLRNENSMLREQIRRKETREQGMRQEILRLRRALVEKDSALTTREGEHRQEMDGMRTRLEEKGWENRRDRQEDRDEIRKLNREVEELGREVDRLRGFDWPEPQPVREVVAGDNEGVGEGAWVKEEKGEKEEELNWEDWKGGGPGEEWIQFFQQG